MKKYLFLFILLFCSSALFALSEEVGHKNIVEPVTIDGSVSVSGDVSVTASSASDDYDEATGAKITIEFPHSEVHEGDHYKIVGSSSLTNGQICEFIIKTPNTAKWAHLLIDYQSNASAFTLIGYEGVTVATTGATAVTPFNNDRNSSNTSGLSIWRSTGTATTSATIIDGLFTIGSSGNPQTRVGGQQSRSDELILKQNTWYVFRFTNGADTNVINFRFSWYEHTNN
jgi:hypothetical protein